MNKKIRFAVIGCGHIGKRHAEMITRDEGAELVALCDIRPKEELGIEAYAVPFARNIDELFRLGLDIDVVNICTPNGLHAEMAIQAIESGHHVVIEKPMAVDLGGCRESGLYLVEIPQAGILRDAKPIFPAFGLD